MTAEHARDEAPRPGALAPSVTPADAEATEARLGRSLGSAVVDPEAEAEAQTRPDADESLPMAPSAVIEPLVPEEDATPEDDSTPFPTLSESAQQMTADPLEAPPDTAAAPPPLPASEARPSGGHLRLVSEAEPATPPRLEGEGQPTLPPEDTASGRAFGTNPPRGPTPPPVADRALHAQLEDYTPPLRREESVLEEAEALRHRNLFRLRRWGAGLKASLPDGLVRRAPDVRALARPLVDRGVRAASRVGDVSLVALRRFEKLPRKKQLLWVAAPYAVALVLVGLLIGSSADEEVTPLAAEPTEPGLVAAPPPAPEPAAEAAEAAAQAPADEAPEPSSAPERAVLMPAADAAEPEPAGLTTEQVRLPRRTKLFVRADARSRRPIRLRRGTALTVYPDFPTPEGWRLVQTEKGTVGFVSALHLADQPDPRVDRRRRRRR